AEFQKKSLGKMNQVAHSGRTVVFVSHDIAALQSLCTKGMVFESGRLTHSGTIESALQRYQKSMAALASTELGPISTTDRTRYIRSIDMVDEAGASVRSLSMGSDLRLRIQTDFP